MVVVGGGGVVMVEVGLGCEVECEIDGEDNWKTCLLMLGFWILVPRTSPMDLLTHRSSASMSKRGCCVTSLADPDPDPL
jgi:hypothetical protein